MAQYSCDGSGVITVYNDANQKLFDRVAGTKVKGWSLTPTIANLFATADEITGLARMPNELAQKLAISSHATGVATAAGGAIPTAAVAIAAMNARFAIDGATRLSRGQAAVKYGMTEAQLSAMETEMAKRMGISTFTMPA